MNQRWLSKYVKQKRNKTISNEKFYRWANTTFENSRSKLLDKMLYGPSCNVEQINLNCKYFVNIIRSLTTDPLKAVPSTLQLSGRSMSKREWISGAVIRKIFSFQFASHRMVRRFEWSQNQFANNSTLLDTALENRSSSATKCKYSYLSQ